jgi:hypothetical protein
MKNVSFRISDKTQKLLAQVYKKVKAYNRYYNDNAKVSYDYILSGLAKEYLNKIKKMEVQNV